MKFLVVVALFAFVAVQVCQSAPLPEDDKVAAPEKVDAAVPAGDVVATPAASEVPKAEPEPKSDVAVPKASEVAPSAAPAEEKKD